MKIETSTDTMTKIEFDEITYTVIFSQYHNWIQRVAVDKNRNEVIYEEITTFQ